MQDHPSPPADTPARNPLAYPDREGLPPKVTLAATLQGIVTDAAEVITRPEPGEEEARILDGLTEEISECAAMARALPLRPAEMSGSDRLLLMALRTSHQRGEAVAETVARGLARLADELGGSSEVIKNRPGSWEAAAVARLLSGTVAEDDEMLGHYGASS